MPNGPILIAAFSARALAESARRSGYTPYVADLFGDDDTIAASAGYRKVAGDLESGFGSEALLIALSELQNIAPLTGRSICTVYGGGFDAAPYLLASINQQWPVMGNRHEILRLIKNPFVFQEVCHSLNIRHPQTARILLNDGLTWLEKRIGGAGGGHVRHVRDSPLRYGSYYQVEVVGRSVSALFIADGESPPVIIGLSEQWTAPVPDQQFRYGGAAHPADVRPDQMSAITESVTKIAGYFGLRGLNSADFIIDGSNIWLLEINPRPGATLELFDNDVNKLFDQHVRPAANISRWEPKHFHVDYTSASAVVYADRGDLIAPAIPEPPDWLKDRPQPGSKILRNQPLCTVLAKGETLSECRQVCAERGLFAQALYYNK